MRLLSKATHHGGFTTGRTSAGRPTSFIVYAVYAVFAITGPTYRLVNNFLPDGGLYLSRKSPKIRWQNNTPTCHGKIKEEVHDVNHCLHCNFSGLFDVLCPGCVRIRVTTQVILACSTAKKMLFMDKALCWFHSFINWVYSILLFVGEKKKGSFMLPSRLSVSREHIFNKK